MRLDIKFQQIIQPLKTHFLFALNHCQHTTFYQDSWQRWRKQQTWSRLTLPSYFNVLNVPKYITISLSSQGEWKSILCNLFSQLSRKASLKLHWIILSRAGEALLWGSVRKRKPRSWAELSKLLKGGATISSLFSRLDKGLWLLYPESYGIKSRKYRDFARPCHLISSRIISSLCS